MEGELHNLKIVLASIFMSSCYCYATTNLIPKGIFRFFIFLPILYLFFHLPLQLNTFSFSIPTAFFVTWLTTFKLILLAFGNGPLSNPSLPFTHFFLIYFFPINLPDQKPKKSDGFQTPNSNKVGLRHFTKNALILLFLIYLGHYKHKFPRSVLLFLISIYIYVGLEVLLSVFAIIAKISLGAHIDPPFDDPYLATSFQDFWGRRWNRVASTSLRSTIFQPTFNCTCGVLGRKWASFLGLMVTFMVSDVMHEVLFYYLGRKRFGWGPPIFFLFHGFLVAFESMVKKKIHVKWRIPQVVSGPLIFGFTISTFMWLVLPELLVLKIDDKALSEYAIVIAFVKKLCLI